MSATPDSKRPGPGSSLRATLLLALVVAPLGIGVWRGVLELTLLGWDTWPLIATARVEGLGELFASLGRELMDGRYPLGHYWRPVTQLSFALDHALFGLEPRGYLATGLAILVVSAWLVGRIVLAWPTTGARPGQARRAALVGMLVGALAFVLHPAHFEILTVPARRADALAALWTLAAVLLQLAPWSRRRALAVGAACALALASKETGAVATPLLLLLAWFQSSGVHGERGARARCGGVLRRTWPVLVAGGAAVALRTLALGGVGGGEGASLALDPVRILNLYPVYVGLVVDPPAASAWLPWMLPLGIALLLVPVARAARTGRETSPALSIGASAAFLGLWLLGLTVVSATSGVVEAWYALPYLAAFAVAAGWLARVALEAVGLAPSLAGLALLALVLVGLLRNARGAGGGQALADHREVSRETERLLAELESKLEAAPPGTSVPLTASFEWARLDERGELVRKILPLGPYGLEAWAELRFPARKVFVVTAGERAPRAPDPDETRVDVRAVPRVLGD